MGMLAALTLCAAGLAVLILGAELLVSGGVRIAARMGISPMLIGMTVVAIGTSAPELAVGIDAAIKGSGDLAVGNIAGTNVVNILLILGLSAFMLPLALRPDTLRLDLPMIVAASLLLWALCADASLSRVDGLVLMAGALVYTALILNLARRDNRAARAAVPPAEAAPADSRRAVLDLMALAGGIVIAVVGADLLVDGAVALARLWQVSDAFIGLTVVAIGTSAPELVTTLVSTLKRQRDIAIGNLLGSSTYNILFILGVTCVISPDAVAVNPVLLGTDIPVMVAVSLLCVPVFFSGRQVSRLEGGAFVAAYLGYLAYTIVTRT